MLANAERPGSQGQACQGNVTSGPFGVEDLHSERARVTPPDNPERDRAASEFGLTPAGEAVAAAARQPGGTLLLRSDRLTPAELADNVLARAGLRQAYGDSKPMRQARPPPSKETQGASHTKRIRSVAYQVKPGI
jgi:hypothetical protein